MKRFIFAHDLGTTGDKATLFDGEGRLIASTFGGHETAHPQPTWAEQDPNDWWHAVCNTTQALLAKSKVASQDIAAVSFSGQMMGCLPVDNAGNPLRPCIIWADQRAVAQAAQHAEQVGEKHVYRITARRISPTYSASKIMWVCDNEPDLFGRVHKFMHVKDYITYRMTGAFATDRSDASGMNLYNFEGGTWSEEILNAIGLDSHQLPDIHNSTDIIGEITKEAAEQLRLAAGTPVVIGGGDGASVAVGAGAITEGPAYNYIGSSSWISFAARRPIYDPDRRIFN